MGRSALDGAAPGYELPRPLAALAARVPRIERAPGSGEAVIAGMFAVSLLLSLALLVFRPLPSGHAYQLGVRVTGVLAAIWLVVTFRPGWLRRRRFLGGILAVGLFYSVQRPLRVEPRSEILAAYGSAFAALDAGKNPYTSRSVVHFDEHGRHELGNFNYPPLELVAYYGIAKLAGRWDHVVLTLALAALHLVASGLLLFGASGQDRRTCAAFVPLLVAFELRTNVALTLLGVALIVHRLRAPRSPPRARDEWLSMALFGLALHTKFLVIPLFATYVMHRLEALSWRALAHRAARVAAALGVAAALAFPFGVGNVLRETVLFNLVLSERAKLTTFYPNALSGTLSWLGVPEAFPVLAVVLLGAATVWSRRLPLLPAMFFTASAFLLVSPTPEPQYIPVMLYLALSGALAPEAAGAFCVTPKAQPGEGPSLTV